MKCNKCGKDMDEWDIQENFTITSYELGYGSEHDGSGLRLQLCCSCMDELINSCSICPLKESNNPFYEALSRKQYSGLCSDND